MLSTKNIWGLHNSSYQTEAKFNIIVLLFIKNTCVSNSLTSFSPCRLSYKNIWLFLGKSFRIWRDVFFSLQLLLKKEMKAIVYSCTSDLIVLFSFRNIFQQFHFRNSNELFCHFLESCIHTITARLSLSCLEMRFPCILAKNIQHYWFKV